MGYTSIYVGQTKDTCKTLMTRELEQYGSIKVIKSAMVSGVYYAAYTHSKYPNEVHGIVCLVSKRNGEFTYKDIDEEMGPFESKCPTPIIDLLTPTKSEYANQWRERCIAYAQSGAPNIRKRLNALPIGSHIIVNGEYHCVKYAPSYGKKKPFFMIERAFKYVPISRIAKFEVIEVNA